MSEPSVELALAELKRTLDVGFTKTDGQLALLLQRTETVERRVGAQDAVIDRLDGRMDEVEATHATRDEVTKLGKQLREEMTEQRRADAEMARRRLMLATVIVAVVAILVQVAGIALK